ncbi:unnamed protein product [Rhizoctonia solani]|uniref:Laminin domain protein n=1 Tax=Rhizoctonia solani TaxID=456999 RepID=A0A8H3HQ03_9AGAM|nr:unnamed protein product [Rhizoctonia solani]
MSSDEVYSPPELPQHLKHICDLKPIVGAPSDEELVGIHAVIQVANKVIDVHGVGDSALLFRLSEHLFDAQMARYRVKYLGAIFPEARGMTYTPPPLPVHVSIRLEPVSGVPSEHQVIRVQDAIRAYQQFSNVSSMFDPRVNLELSEHLFDIQMAKHMQRVRQSRSSPPSCGIPRSSILERATAVTKESDTATNNTGSGADVPELARTGRVEQDAGILDAVEKSNRLAEQANQLAERANLLIQRSNELMERSNEPVDHSNKLAERFNELVGRLNEQFERSNKHAEELIKPVEKFEDTLRNTNRVLSRIQHAIIRSNKGNTVSALDCLTNEKGETPAVARTTGKYTFADFSKRADSNPLPVIINGVLQNASIPNIRLAGFLQFYEIGSELRDPSGNKLLEGKHDRALTRLSEYLSSCLG